MRPEALIGLYPLQVSEATMSVQPLSCMGGLNLGLTAGNVVGQCDWRRCLSELVGEGSTLIDANTKFLYLKVVESYLQTQYDSAPQDEQVQLRQYLIRWIMVQCTQQLREQKFIHNKMGQIFSLVFIKDFPHRWPSFFTDLVGTLSFGRTAVEFYLIVLSTMDSEVFSSRYNRSEMLVKRSTELKDVMRESSVQIIADSWYQILTSWHADPDIATACLEVTAVYVSWIDVTSVANDKFLPVVLELMRSEYGRGAAADLLCGLVDKGMDVNDKVQVVTRIVALLRNFAVPLHSNQNTGPNFAASMANLVNSIGMSLLQCCDGLKEKGDIKMAMVVFSAAEENVLWMDEYLQHQDDTVCTKVTKFAKEYIRKLKGKGLSENQMGIVQRLLKTVMDKMKLPLEYFSTSNDDHQQALLDLRNDFKVIFGNLLVIDKQLVTQCVYQVVSAVLKDLNSYSVSDIEWAIFTISAIAENIPIPPPNQVNDTQTAPALLRMMLLELLSSGVSNHPHPAVTLQYLETVARRDKLFLKEPELIPPVLEALLGPRGLRSNDKKLRARSAFLFQIFVKSLRSTLASCAIHVIANLKVFLEVSPPQSNGNAWLSHDDQLHLYGAVGLLIVCGPDSPAEKGQMVRSLLVPVVARYQTMSSQLEKEGNEKTRSMMISVMSHSMAVVTGVSKAFNSLKDTKALGCFQMYYEVLQVFLTCLQTPAQKSLLHSGLRQFLHRMVICLEAEVLPCIPFVLEAILRDQDAYLLSEFMPLVLQVIMKFKGDAAAMVQQLLAPLLACFTAAWAADTDKDNPYAQEENHYLFRSFLGLMAAVVTNNLVDVLLSQEQGVQQQALDWVIQGTYHDPDPTAQKSCYTILRKMVEQWGGVIANPDGFNTFLYEKVIPACYLPLKKLDDSQAECAAVGRECSQLITAIYKKRGEEFLCHLQGTFLPSLGLDPLACERHVKSIRDGNHSYQQCMEVLRRAL